MLRQRSSDVTVKHTMPVSYRISWPQPVCCSESHIYVAQNPGSSIRVHTWDGECRLFLSHQELGLKERDWIHGLQYNRREGILQMAVGDQDMHYVQIHSLHALQVSVS